MTSATAQAWPDAEGGFTRLRLRFRAWRRTRPFWGGLLAMIAGLPILYFPYAHLTLGGLTVAMSTTAGAGSLIIGLLMMVLGVSAWFQPLVRVFCGVGVTILSLISIPVSNLGGFLMGLILGLVAGGLLCSWAPLKEQPVGPAAEAAALQPAGAGGQFAAFEGEQGGPGGPGEQPQALGYQVVPYQPDAPEAESVTAQTAASESGTEVDPTTQQGELR
ncbi:hypothetical protein P3T36_002567 [Kitasatospora sp. MAP12-15]|uniref:DUF6114 domain-containing protein n=1 Tax=unclassified Kitasatospora TaxID=2633591 RepID=UPI0024739359|nr:DUF6114 domain-containing protein [Kitasatospora sp. MAP12-44]MDH6112849.1 hypothetical protein [Kitasatospora sp. MAP12-44]